MFNLSLSLSLSPQSNLIFLYTQLSILRWIVARELISAPISSNPVEAVDRRIIVGLFEETYYRAEISPGIERQLVDLP